jgi:hypothetical protein
MLLVANWAQYEVTTEFQVHMFLCITAFEIPTIRALVGVYLCYGTECPIQ